VTRWVGAWAPAAIWAAALYLLSSRSSVPVPRIAGIDKVAHFTAYLILGYLSAHATKRLGAPVLLAIGVGWIYGVLDEFHQSFVPRRDPSFGDWIADAAGVLVGVCLCLLLHRARARSGATSPTGLGAEPNR
jgi:VanZ family protein